MPSSALMADTTLDSVPASVRLPASCLLCSDQTRLSTSVFLKKKKNEKEKTRVLSPHKDTSLHPNTASSHVSSETNALSISKALVKPSGRSKSPQQNWQRKRRAHKQTCTDLGRSHFRETTKRQLTMMLPFSFVFTGKLKNRAE